MKNIIIFFLLGCLFVSCSSSPDAMEEALSQTLTALPTNTPYPTNTISPTETQTPTITIIPTETKSPTPTITPTNTNTPTPFDTTNCTNMEIYVSIHNTRFSELLEAQKRQYDNKCVKMIYDPIYGYLSPKSIFTIFEFSDLGPRGTLNIKEDPETRIKVKSLMNYSYVWGIFTMPNNLLLKRIEELPVNQKPIKGDILGRC